VPGWDERSFYIDVAGSYLIVSTDEQAAGRVAAGGASFAEGHAGEAQALLGAQPWDGLFLLDVAATLGMTWRAEQAAPPLADALGNEQDATRATLQRELAAIEAEMYPLQMQVQNAMRAQALATTRPLGSMLLVAHAGEAGVALFGGQLTSAPHLSDAVLGWVMGWLALSGVGEIAPDTELAAQRERLEQLHTRRWELVQQLVAQPAPPESAE
jgi:hypothetical protein